MGKVRAPARWWLLALLFATSIMSLAACRWFSGGEPTPRWLGDGGELGGRVRAGRVAGVVHHRFLSELIGRDVGLVVATPRGYAAHPDRRYPVVYVFPGIGGDEWTYLRDVGLHGVAMKTLSADQEAAPIVVFCNPGDSGAFNLAARVLAEELVSFVDRTYRTRTDASGRSLDGFSLGGVTALTLLTQRPEVFGRAVATSSACYLLNTCGALRESLRALAPHTSRDRVLLALGAKENSANQAINRELAPLWGVPVVVVPGADHDWAAQLQTRVAGRELGRRIAEFHLAGFAR